MVEICDFADLESFLFLLNFSNCVSVFNRSCYWHCLFDHTGQGLGKFQLVGTSGAWTWKAWASAVPVWFFIFLSHYYRLRYKWRLPVWWVPGVKFVCLSCLHVDCFYTSMFVAVSNPFASLWCRELYKNNIQGTIPSELGNLKSLISLDLYNNNISGTIPPSLGKLKSLVFLWVQLNLAAYLIIHFRFSMLCSDFYSCF